MNVKQVLQVALPVAAAATAAVVAAPYVVDAIRGDDASSTGEPPAPDPAAGSSTPPDPLPMPAPATGGATDAQSGAGEVATTTPAPAPAPDPAPAPAPVRTYQNPVFDGDAPDPSVIRGEDGNWYAYTTEVGFFPFGVLKSPDLVHWERAGAAFENGGPSWIAEHRWAPDVKRTGDHYTMLYSGRGHDGKMRIGYATSQTAAGPFQDRGVLVEGNSVGYYIDPDLVETPNGWKLLYGSTGGNNPADQTGISEVDVQVAADGTMSVASAPKVVLSEQGERYLVEGAWMQEHDGMWYLFYSDGKWDAKGGPDDYAVKVARSASPDGPFEKLGRPVMSAGAGFTGTGHMSITTDDAGQDWMLYHAWGSDASKGRTLLLDPIMWKDGWPVVGDDGHPSSGTTAVPTVR